MLHISNKSLNLPCNSISSSDSIPPSEKKWHNWNKKQVANVVDNLRAQYLPSLADGFIIKIGDQNEVIEMDQQRSSLEDSITMPGAPCAGECSLCQTTNHHVKLEDDFMLLRSLSGRALIISTKPISASWVEMDRQGQIDMIQCAQKVIQLIKDIPTIDPSNTVIEFHCGKNAKQTVSHTHLRLNGLSNQNRGNPSLNIWDQIISRLK